MNDINFESLGLPKINIEKWFSGKRFNRKILPPAPTPKVIRNKQIPLLSNYKDDPGQEFWLKFPYNPLPNTMDPKSDINIESLQEKYLQEKIII